MTGRNDEDRSVSDVVADRVREVRRRRGLTAAQLAVRCAALGMPDLTASTLSNIETGRRDETGRRRRDVSVDELLTLAAALDVAPVHLLVPPLGSPLTAVLAEPNDEALYAVTPTRATRIYRVRQWIRGERPLPDADPWLFFAEIPGHEKPSTEQLEELIDKERAGVWRTETMTVIEPEARDGR